MTDNLPHTLALLAAGSTGLHGDLTGVVVLFGTALAAAGIMRALRAPAILGFLLAGILIGPSGLDLIHRDKVHFFAELGLALLLFTVGLELSPGPLLRMGRRLLLAAGIQIAATGLLSALVVALLLSSGWVPALITGIAVALSSTAIVLKTLSERGETDTPAGAITTGILLIQDVAVIFVLILLPLFAGAEGVHWLHLIGKAGLALAGLVVVVLVARLVLPRVVNRLFRRGGQDLMTLFAVVMACAGAWLASLADWSWALGACIAGLLLAQTDLRHQLCAEITPFRDAFNALFFMSIGMLVDLALFQEHAAGLGIAIAVTLVIKGVLAGTGVLAAGWPLRLALVVGIGLCTMSEFGYVLAKEAHDLELMSPELFEIIVAWAAGTMLVGAIFVPLANPLAGAIARRAPGERPWTAAAEHADTDVLTSHVVIVGYGLNGRNLARVLRSVGIPYGVIEMNRASAHLAQENGARVVVVGDATRMAILEQVRVSHARALVIAIADQYATRHIVAQVHARQPELYILARTRYVAEIEPLYRLGARLVVPEEFETSVEMFAHVLKEFGVPDNVIEQQVTLIRAGHYGMLRGRPTDKTVRAEWLSLLEAAVTQTFLVMEDSVAAGKTIRELDFRARVGVTVVAITRAGKPTPSPTPEFRLEAGDVLVLVGTHRQLDEVRALLTPPT